MHKFITLGVVIVAGVNATHPISDEMVNEIKQRATTWVPMEVSENPLANFTSDQLKGLVGAKEGPKPIDPIDYPVANDLPASFDSREKWGSKIHPIRNQHICGSCWAFGATEALSDRFAIASDGKIDVVLSPQDLVSCSFDNAGCNGGYLELAWKYLNTDGAVSDECLPYTAGNGTVEHCPTQCKDESLEFKKYKCKDGSVRLIINADDQIQTEIAKNGPVETSMRVFQDFYSYKSGIYQHTTGELVGGHAVKLLGWGNENGTDYWLLANSWGADWGEDGYFKIKTFDSGICLETYTCDPNIDEHLKL